MFSLGIDTGGTYTDAVVMDANETRVLAKAKALTSRPDLSVGVAEAIDAVIATAAIDPADIGLVSLSTTLATNALVEGQGERVALVFIGFSEADLGKSGLADALGRDPVIYVSGGHGHAGEEKDRLDLDALQKALDALSGGVTAFAIASRFGTRNPAHELAARDVIRARTGLPVTCSHELSSALGGPKRALTALLNARLLGLIFRLISACADHLQKRGIAAPLMVVRGDGALVSAALAQERPIETILSGPAASIAGAGWLADAKTALVSDIGGTTTDVCLLQDGRPAIDPDGAKVGGHRTMVEAVAMHTFGLGGDSEVHVTEGLKSGLRLGPRRLMPVSLLAVESADVVYPELEAAQRQEVGANVRFAVPLFDEPPSGLDDASKRLVARLASGPAPLAKVATGPMDRTALGRLVKHGIVALSGVTPSDAAHALGLADHWDADAARLALKAFARRRGGSGDRLADDAEQMARLIVAQLTLQSADHILHAAFANDERDWPAPLDDLVTHPLARAGLRRAPGLISVDLRVGVPVIGLGASARSYYGDVGQRLGTEAIIPEHADVANAIGAVVGRVRMQETGQVTAPSAGRFVAHLPEGPQTFGEQAAALSAMETALSERARAKAAASGVADPLLEIGHNVEEAEIEGAPMFVRATVTVVASGRPRIAAG